MFKRSLASFAAVAVASGAVVAPANAMTVTVNDDTTCTIELTDEEAKLTGSKPSANLNKEKAAHLKATLLDKQLPALGAEIEKDKQELDKPGLDEAAKATLKSALEEKEKRFIANNNFKKALEACIDGKSYDSNQSDDSKQPDGSNKPDDSGKPGGSGKPGDGHASSSIDGAGIGVIVAVLGILAAALSFIKPLLPAQLRALLP